jgi:phage baseplate assembly protein gpV
MDHCLTYGLEYHGLFYGLYKARVIDNQDPLGLGRLKIHCEQVHGTQYPDVWAQTFTPYAGDGFGLFAIPDKGELVWVAFDHGRAEYPIWLGGWYAYGEPTPDMVPTNVVLAVKEGLKLVINRQDKSITILKDNQNSIVMDDNGITIITDKDVAVTAQGNVKVTAQQNVQVQAQEADVNAQTIKMQASTVAITGEVSVNGNLSVSGNSTAGGITTAHHTHPLDLGPPIGPIALPGA